MRLQRPALLNIYKISSKKKYRNLIDIFGFLYNSTPWWKDFRKKWTVYTNSFEELEKVIAKIEKESFEEIAKTFIIIGVLRNNIAHSAFDITFNEKYPSFYFNKIAEAIWYCWGYAEKNLLKTK